MSGMIVSSVLNGLTIKLFRIFYLSILIYELLFYRFSLAVTSEILSGNDHKTFDSNNASNQYFKISEGTSGSLSLISGSFDSRDYSDSASQFPLISLNNTLSATKLLKSYTINIAAKAISSHFTPVIDINKPEVLGDLTIVNGYVNQEYNINPEGSHIYRTLLFSEDLNPHPLNYGIVINASESQARLNLIQNNFQENIIHGNIKGSNNGDQITLNGGFVYGSLLLGNGVNTVTLANNAYLEASKEMLTNEVAIICGSNQEILNILDNSKVVAGSGKDAITINGASTPSVINVTGNPEIHGSITAVNSANHVLNIGNNQKAATYITHGDINNINNIELNNPVNYSTTLINNNNITGVKNLVVHYNAKAKTDHGSIKAFVANIGQTADANYTVSNYGDFLLDNESLVYGFQVNNNGHVTISNNSSTLFYNAFNNAGNLLIQSKGDLSAINTASNLSNYLNKSITVEQDATIGKIGPLGAIINDGNIFVKGKIYADSLVNQNNGSIALHNNAVLNLDGTNAQTSGVFNNLGDLLVPAGSTINAKQILQRKNLVIEGTVNSSIQLLTAGTTLKIFKGEFKDVSAVNAGNLLEIYGPVSTDGDLTKISIIKIMENNFIVNNSITQIEDNFTNYQNTMVAIEANGDLSGKGSINNLGTIMLKKNQYNIGGTIGALNGMNEFNNQGTFIADGGDMNIIKFTNNAMNANLQINSGVMSVNSFHNIAGNVSINNGELFYLNNNSTGTTAGTTNVASNAGNLINNNNQFIIVMNEGKIGNTNPFNSIKNYGSFNILDQSIVKTKTFTNNRILNNLDTQVQLNIYGQLLVGANGTGVLTETSVGTTSGTGAGTGTEATTDVGNTTVTTDNNNNIINNIYGKIIINSNEYNNGDLSSNDPNKLTKLNNYYNQSVEIHNQGTIGKVTALGEISNNGTFLANGGNIVVGNFINGSKDTNMNCPGKLTINCGIFKVGAINNVLGSIDIFTAINNIDDNIVSGDLSSNSEKQLSTLTNGVAQVINVNTGTIGKYIPLGEVNNSGIINVNNNINIGDFNNLTSTSSLNITGGISLVGNIGNHGSITISNSAGTIADLSSIDISNPSTLTNEDNRVINILNQGTIGANNHLGQVVNKGIINANGGNIIIGNLTQGIFNGNMLNNNVFFKIQSGKVIAGDIENNRGSYIFIQDADLSSFSQEKNSNLTNRGGTIDVGLNGTIGNAADYSGLAKVLNYNNGKFITNGLTIKIDNFNNGFEDASALGDGVSANGDLIIRNGDFLVETLNNYNGVITVVSGDISSPTVNQGNSTATLNNYANQTININNTGSIGRKKLFNQIINNGEFNCDGSLVKTVDFVNNSHLNLTKGNLYVGNNFSNLGVFQVNSSNNVGADLSSIEDNQLNLINGTGDSINNASITANIIINNLGTIGKNYTIGEINNFGNIEANTSVFKAGDLNNYKKLKIVDTSNVRLNQNLSDSEHMQYSIKLGKVKNYNEMSLDSTNKINKMHIDQVSNVNGGKLNINHHVVINGGVGLINENNSTINLSGDLTITNSTGTDDAFFINNGILNLTKPVNLHKGNYILGDTGIHNVSIVNNIPSLLTLNGTSPNVSILPGSHIYIEHYQEDFIKDIKIFEIISNLNGTINIPDINRVIINGSTLLVNYNIQTPVNNKLSIIAQRKAIKSLIDTGHSYMLELAGSLDNLIYQKVDVDQTLQGALHSLEDLMTQEKLVESVYQLAPDLDLPEVTLSTNNFIVADATAERIAMLARSEVSNISGYSAGSMYAHDTGVWIKGLAGSVKQKMRNNFPGYNATTGGVVFGIDTQFLDHLWFGVGFSNVHTLMRSKDYPSKRVTLDSYQVTAYGSFSKPNYYIDGFASLALNNYKSKREVLIVNQIATAKFKGVQPAFKFAAGYIYNLLGIKIIPNLSLQYSMLYQNPYNEEPASIIGLTKISSDQLKQLEGGVGIKIASREESDDDSVYNYEVHMMMLNDFQAKPRVTTAEFMGGGGSFKITGNTPDKITYNIGASFALKYQNRLHFTFNYDLRKKNKFIGHAGAISVRYLL